VIAVGHWDGRGTLSVDREAPVGLTNIALTLELDIDADAATVQRLVEMTERVLRHLPDLAHAASSAVAYKSSGDG
jgi:hypothetical protein